MVLAEDRDARITELARRIGQLAMADGMTVAVAESLTAGRIAAALGAAPESSTWFCGGVVAYRNETKYRLLGVSRGPVITAECAEQMARGVLDAVGADASVSVTGVGGPGPEEGHPAGTVFISMSSRCAVRTRSYSFHGPPDEVVDLTTIRALTHLTEVLLER
ncbi:CinA family protein [Cryobacterium sp.]|jgi:nicotinamide-nucleotide amidase|uniref:CinA family protein n=1 Tax=Cryobacterium sp. TaxID=1926290 RepID=UPI00262900C7|nr:CinA family protein [Cryobacterium sp.]MCU1445357.1 competence protein [Cryobacterium sp.]